MSFMSRLPSRLNIERWQYNEVFFVFGLLLTFSRILHFTQDGILRNVYRYCRKIQLDTKLKNFYVLVNTI